MDKNDLITQLEMFKGRLLNDVEVKYKAGDTNLAHERFEKWQETFEIFLQDNIPSEVEKFKSKTKYIPFFRKNMTNLDIYRQKYGDKNNAYIDSLIIDVRNDEVNFNEVVPAKGESESIVQSQKNNQVFIVHGHDNEIKEAVARFISGIGLEPIILHEQVSEGKTIIEKLEEYTNVGFAIVLYSPCDEGRLKGSADLKNRARQNVVFEHGYLIGKIGRKNVRALVKGEVEIPNDYSGVIYVPYDDNNGWKFNIIKELKALGYTVDANNAI